MAEQIVIEFIPDMSQVEGVIPTLQKMGSLSKADAEAVQKFGTKADAAFKSANTGGKGAVNTMADLQKNITSLANSFEKQFQSVLVESFSKAGASIAAIKKDLGLLGKSSAFDELKNKINDTNKQLLETAARMESLRRRGLVDTEGYQKLEKQLAAGKLEAIKLATAMENVQKTVTEFSDDSGQSSKKVASLRTEIRQTTEELARMLSAGELSAAQIYDLAQSAGSAKENLDDARKAVQVLSQDSTELTFASTLQGVTALSAGVQGLMSVQALLGVENEDLQKTLVKLNAAMALTQSLQQIKISLDKQEALSLGATVAGNKILAVANRITAGTYAALGVTVEATSVAFKVLRAAIITTGIGALVVGVGYLVNKIIDWTESTEDQVKAQEELNRKMEEYRQKLEKTFNESAAEKARQANIKAINREIKLLEAQGNAEQKIMDLKQKRADLELQSSRVRAATELEYSKVQEEEAERQKDILNDLEVDKIKVAKDAAEKRKKISEDAAKKALDLAKRNADAEFQITERHLKREADLAQKISEDNKNPYDIRLLALRDFFDKSQALIDAQELNELSNKKLTESEKKNIEDKYYTKRLELLDEFNTKRTDIIGKKWEELEEKIKKSFSGITNEFSHDLDNELAGLETVYNMGLITLKEYEEKRQQVQDAYSRKNTLNEIKQLEELIENRKKYNQDVTDLEKDLYNERDKLRQLDLANFEKDNEKKSEIAKESLEEFMSELELARRSQYETISLLTNSINATIPNTEAQKVLTGIASLYVKIKDNIDAVAEAQEKYNQGLITKEELERTIAKARIDNIVGAMAIGQEAINGLYEVAAQKRQAELQQALDILAKERDAELANKNLTEEQKSAIEERFRQKEVQLKKAAYMKDRQAKISQAIINGLLAVTNALATAPTIIAGIALAAVAAATTAVQVTKIKSEPVPQFRKGTRSAPKGYAWVGEEGPELVHLNGGERIWTYKQSEKVYDSWKSGSVASADQILAGRVPKVDYELMNAYPSGHVSSGGGFEIDYKQLGKEIARNQSPVSVINKIDENGLALFIEQKLSSTNIRNSRYTFKK